MNRLLITLTVFAMAISFCGGISTAQNVQAGIDIIPRPRIVQPDKGVFRLDQNTIVYIPHGQPDIPDLAAYLVNSISTVTGFMPEVRILSGDADTRSILLRLDDAANTGDEGYLLSVTPEHIEMTASQPAGLFYAIQSFRQLIDGSARASWLLPACRIEDSPRFGWRGILLDCSRHFMSVEFIKRYIDLIAYHKMNVLHLHLTDDQGWRMEIKKYPGLTETGAWRNEFGKRYGGYYTQAELRDIVSYAATRYVEVVPEIEMPGHATAALAAYPEYSCSGEPREVETAWGIHTDLFCAGKESTFTFLEDILREVCDVFPSPYIHIGGDEAKKDEWEKCPDCQHRIEQEGLADEEALQGYFTERIDKIVRSMGRTTIGWDEILEGGISRSAVVQSWRGMDGALEGTEAGHHVLASPHDYVYFDYPQGPRRAKADWMPVTTLPRVYSFEPVPAELTPEEAALVMGGECSLWSEYAPQPEVDQQIFPRLCAFSEVMWTYEDRDFAGFYLRMDRHYRRLDALGVDYYKPDTRIGEWQPDMVNEAPVELEWDVTRTVTGNGEYRLTFDYEDGAHALGAEWAALYENGVEIARDMHPGRAGAHNSLQNYRFILDAYKPDAEYIVRAAVKGIGGSDTMGSVWIKRFTGGFN